MEHTLHKDIQAGLDAARQDSARKQLGLRLQANGIWHTVLRHWTTGFALDADTAPQVRGCVDIFDGAQHLFQCLVVAATQERGEMQFEFKRVTRVSHFAALDFARPNDASTACITADASHQSLSAIIANL